MNFIDLEERYRRDPQFAQLVDFMVHNALELQMSPGEMRQAAVFAEIKFAMLKPVRQIFPEFARDLHHELMRQQARHDRAPEEGPNQ